ncbi:hypothetical protein WI93_00325 [Burkholderia vietnamiensis]|uniref:Uncharacterized protein n=1 Tax=Burkholderia ubonensis TaxID=101571 RepID=A0A1B4LI90_9BURK|nr:hypothetical protein WJ35_17420 [Burkholderia ubonensis]AOK02423.1 hypothetical protein WK23_27415 [Burkholderia vietnamiensis]AOK13935.1 hypothetical protein WK31_26875 [Burkholderia vietnamiensis]KVE17207.1 hypothetical protein WI92_05230 [Burkholderia vietnamiensis]KVE28154.1 hypothetical protein WI93_00325 [Burkholderia vietnamiensis]
MVPLHALYLPSISMNELLLFTYHAPFVIQNRQSHGDEAFAEIFECHLLPDLGIRLPHRTLEIDTPHDLIDGRLVAKYHVVRAAARGIVLIWGRAMLEQLSDVFPRDIGLVVFSGTAAIANRQFRHRRKDRCGWRFSVAIRAYAGSGYS